MERTFPRTSEGAGPSQDHQAQVCPAASLKPDVFGKSHSKSYGSAVDESACNQACLPLTVHLFAAACTVLALKLPRNFECHV